MNKDTSDSKRITVNKSLIWLLTLCVVLSGMVTLCIREAVLGVTSGEGIFAHMIKERNSLGYNKRGTEESQIELKFNANFSAYKHDGEYVKMRGYMALLSGSEGALIYLMEAPYQDAPMYASYDLDITDSMPAYASSGRVFEFYDGLIEVFGKVRAVPYTDENGFDYDFCISDARYSKVTDLSEYADGVRAYNALAERGLIKDILALFEAVELNAFAEELGVTGYTVVKLPDSVFDETLERLNSLEVGDLTTLIRAIEQLKVLNADLYKDAEADNSVLYDLYCDILAEVLYFIDEAIIE